MDIQKIVTISCTAILLAFTTAAFSLDDQTTTQKHRTMQQDTTTNQGMTSTTNQGATSTSTSNVAPGSSSTMQNTTPQATESKVGYQMGTSNYPVATPAEDAIITKSIENQIGKSSTLTPFRITVATDKGIVTLRGNVDSNSQASSLIEIAQSIIGVRDVKSKLTVNRSQQVLTDTIITAKIKGLFIREALFGAGAGKPGIDMISVETKNGVVYLTGNVNDQQQVNKAIDLIKGIKGVKSVEYKFSKILPYRP